MGQVWEQPQGWVQNPRLVTARGQKLPSSRRGEGMEQWCQPETQKALWEERAAWQGLSGGWRRPTVFAVGRLCRLRVQEVMHLFTSLCSALWSPAPPLAGPSQKSEARGGERGNHSFSALGTEQVEMGGEGKIPRARGRCGNIFKSLWTKFSAKKGLSQTYKSSGS